MHLVDLFNGNSSRNQTIISRRRMRCLMEALESRQLLSAMVNTDLADYAPGSTALFTATTDGGTTNNFLAGETIQFHVTRTDGTPIVSPAIQTFNATDGKGDFIPYQDTKGMWWFPDTDGQVNGVVQANWEVDPQFLNAALGLTARGLTSGVTATTNFTDKAGGTLVAYPTTVLTSSTQILSLIYTGGGGSNTGDNANNARSIVITVPAGWTASPSGLQISTTEGTKWTVSLAGNTITAQAVNATADQLHNNQAVIIDLTATATSSASNLNWTAHAYTDINHSLGDSGGKNDPIAVVSSSTTNHSASVSPTSVNTGISSTFTLTLTNTSSSATNAQTAAIILPSGFTFGSFTSATTSYNGSGANGAAWTGSYAKGTLSLTNSGTASELRPNGVLTVKFTATATTPGTDTWVTEMARGATIFVASAQPTSTITTLTSLTTSAVMGTYGGNVNLSATLNAGSSRLAGHTVNFAFNGAAVGSALTNASGVATLSGVSLAGINAGSYATGLSASFTGDSTYVGSSNSANLTVNKASLTVTANSLSKPFGQVNPTLTGTIIGVVGLDGITASYSTPATQSDYPGIYAIAATTADPKGKQGNYNITINSGTLTITKTDCLTTVTTSSNPITACKSVTFSATVSSASVTPTGKVQFLIDGVNAGSAITLAADGTATYTTRMVVTGTHTISALYSGDSNYNPGSGSLSQNVILNQTTSVTFDNGIFTLVGQLDTSKDSRRVFGLTGDIAISGDWNGDGSTEMGVFRAGTFILDNGNGSVDSGDFSFNFGSTGDKPVTGDWNGDGITEVGVFRNGTFYLDSNGSHNWNTGDATFVYGTTGDQPVAADWNKDGTTDIGVFRNGTFYLDSDGNHAWTASDSTFVFGSTGDQPVVGDWNGDSTAKVGVYRSGTFYLDQDGSKSWNTGDVKFSYGAGQAVISKNSSSATSKIGVYSDNTFYIDGNANHVWDGDQSSFKFGTAGDLAVAGDWNGDGKKEVGVFRSGLFYLDLNGSKSWDSSDIFFSFGLAGDKPVTGDWNGDGIDEVGIFRNGVFYLDLNGSRSWNAGDTTFTFGTTGDQPVAGDWNGDGKSEVGVQRSGKFFLDQNGSRSWDASDVSFTFGCSSCTPLSGDWNGDGKSEVAVFYNGTFYRDTDGSKVWDYPDDCLTVSNTSLQALLGTWV